MSGGGRRGVFAALVALALAIRLAGLGAQSLSNDELLERGIAGLPAAEIVTAADGFPPLYPLLLHAWRAAFDGTGRLLSALLGTLAVAAAWPLAHRALGPATAPWAALLLAVSPYHVHYSQEARAYPLYFLAAVVALWLFYRARATGTAAGWAWFALAAGVGAYTHYYFALLVAGTGLLVLAGRPRWPELRRPLAAYLGIGLLVLPLALLVGGDLSFQAGLTSQTRFGILAFGYSLFAFVAGFALGPSTRELHVLAPGEALGQVLPWLLAAGLAAAWLAAAALPSGGGPDNRGERPARRPLELAFLTVFAVVACGLMSNLSGVGYKSQYVVWAAAPLLLVLARGAASWAGGRWPVRVAAAVLLSLCAVSLVQRARLPRYQTEDVRAAAAWLDRHAGAAEPIFVVAPYMDLALGHYLPPGRAVHRLPAVERREQLGRALEFVAARDGGGALWLVYTRPFHGDPRGMLRDALIARGGLEQRAGFAGVEVYGPGAPEAR